ncbi:unnamed protein product [Arctogadus glacialis]
MSVSSIHQYVFVVYHRRGNRKVRTRKQTPSHRLDRGNRQGAINTLPTDSNSMMALSFVYGNPMEINDFLCCRGSSDHSEEGVQKDSSPPTTERLNLWLAQIIRRNPTNRSLQRPKNMGDNHLQLL